MKYSKYIIALGSLCAVLFSTACKENLLDVSPAANNTSNVFYQNEAQLNQAVLSIYNTLRTMPTNNWLLSEVRADNGLESFVNVQRDVNDIGNFLAASQTGAIQTTWSTLYTQIYRANILLDKIQPFTFAKVGQFKGEAQFLRAMAYFDLVRYFGDVPMTTKVLSIDESKKIQREPFANVYNLIVEDLKFAVANLPEAYVVADKGRATKWAAKALLGRVYLTMAGFPLKQVDKLALAKTEFADVIAQETKYFPLAPVYADMFKAINDNKYFVFEVQYVSGGLGLGNLAPFDMAFQFPSQWSAFQPSGYDAVVSPQLMAGWPNLDKRKFATVDTGYTDAKTGAKSTRSQFTKFLEKGSIVPVDRYDHPVNYPLIRYEDVLLSYAEILNEEAAAPPAQAITILNRIRTRAGIASITPATKDAFKLALEQERQWEFCGEGLRWHDLVRTGRAIQVVDKFLKDNGIPIGRSLDDHDLLYPIPLKELLINPGYWKQNPGYN